MSELSGKIAENPTVDVIIPVYKPGKRLGQLLGMLKKQSYPVQKIIIMNTEQSYWDEAVQSKVFDVSGVENLEIHHVTKVQFDHGATRNQGAGYSKADIMIFLTDDAVPQDRYLVENLVKGFSKTGSRGEMAAEVYGRQLPGEDCKVIEQYTRKFNYPARDSVKTKQDLERLGIKTYFASNACCAYRRDIFEKQGGFITRTIFNEDMIYAAGVIGAGYAIAYAAEARVIHSHNLTPMQQFRRNFDLAVSQADHPEIFAGIKSEGEGIRMVKQNANWLLRSGHALQIPALVVNSGFKYLGYLAGKRYQKLPMAVVRWCSMNKAYWVKAGTAADSLDQAGMRPEPDNRKQERKEGTGV